MARATGKIILQKPSTSMSDGFITMEEETFENGDIVTIELPRGMKVIGKREECRLYLGNHPIFVRQIKCGSASDEYRFVHKNNCPCHNWKARKK